MMSGELIAYVLAVYLLAGCLKGVVGLGLPTISLALLATVLGLKEAMILLIIPSFITNLVQAISGPNFIIIVRRIWFFLLPLCLLAWWSTGILIEANTAVLKAGLGGILIIYAIISLGDVRIKSFGKYEFWMAPFFGGLTGISTGLTGTFAVPGVFYLQALGLKKDAFVQAMGICFTVATAALAVSLGGRGVVSEELIILSAVAVIPALIGMKVGSKIRKNLPETMFRKFFFIALLFLGGWISFRSGLF